jgi:hypothetical protein
MCKRITIATIFGILCGIVCWLLSSSGGKLPWALSLSIVTGRTLIGVAIGISALKIKWWLHGPIMGLVFSIPMGFSSMMAAGVKFTPNMLFIMTVVMGIIYGFIIELFTTVVFKAKA